LEAGLCLYGHDIDQATTPVEASLTWAIQKARRSNGSRASGYIGSEIILKQLAGGTNKKRVGLLPQTRAPMREGVEIFATETSKEAIGKITSGGYGPTVGYPIAMGYINSEYANSEDDLFGELRGKRVPVKVSNLPFVPLNFKR
jgi:aminomethyltransferase